jgi:hypothetical protein
MEIKPNTCPYCGGPYTINQTCNGPRTNTPGENACEKMKRHSVMVSEAAEANVTEDDE